MSSKRFLTVVAWSAGVLSLAGFAAAWVLAVRNRDLPDLSAEFAPDRFMVAYAVAISVLAAAALFSPLRDQVDLDVLGEDLRGVVDQVLAPEHLSLWVREPGPFG